MDSNTNVVIDVPLVERLIARQFPQFSDLPISVVENSGWDNRTFHLGDTMSVRLPSTPSYAPAIAKEQRWLPRLAPHLPLPIPQPVALGQPDAEYPSPWSLYRWLEGDFATSERVSDQDQLAVDLAQFLGALQNIDPTDGPRPANYPGARGRSLSVLDGAVVHAVADLHSVLLGAQDVAAVEAIWREALAASVTDSGDSKPVWLHGDVAQGNLLVQHGRLCAVIDFGSVAVGDPACDTVIAWTFFDEVSRATFRRCLALDDSAWARGRGWALWKALIVCAKHIETNALEAASAEKTLASLVQDYHARTDSAGALS